MPPEKRKYGYITGMTGETRKVIIHEFDPKTQLIMEYVNSSQGLMIVRKAEVVQG